MTCVPLLGAIRKIESTGEGSHLLKYLQDPIIVLLALVPIIVIAFIWAKASSRKRRHHSRRRHHHRLSPEESQALVESWKVMRASRRRRKHRHQREHANPSLAETGGLPPLRSATTAAQAPDLPPPPATVPPLQREDGRP